MKVILAPKVAHKWILDAVGYIPTPEIQCIACITEPEKEGDPLIIHGMTALDMWTDNSVQAHICIEDPKCARKLVRATMQYAYACGKDVVIGVTPGDLPEAKRFMKGIGFVELCRIKDGNRKGVDTIISEQRKENSRWAEKPVEEKAVEAA